MLDAKQLLGRKATSLGLNPTMSDTRYFPEPLRTFLSSFKSYGVNSLTFGVHNISTSSLFIGVGWHLAKNMASYMLSYPCTMTPPTYDVFNSKTATSYFFTCPWMHPLASRALLMCSTLVRLFILHFTWLGAHTPCVSHIHHEIPPKPCLLAFSLFNHASKPPHS